MYSDENLLGNSIDLLCELIFNPNVKNNKFDSKNFEIIKDKLNLIIESQKENTQKYALNRSLELMDENDPVSYNLWGYKEDLNKINEENLYEYYKKVLKTNKIDIFVVGNFDKEKIISLFEKKFILNDNNKNEFEPFITYKKSLKTKVIEESINLQQSKLSIICKVLNLNLFERRYVLPIYTSILGGNSSSRLFINVREKNSLAYTVSASSKAPNSIFMIYSGIDADDYDEALKLIKKEIILKNIKEEELEIAKKELISAVEVLNDNPSNIINYYFGIEVFKSDPSNLKIENYKKVTIKDLEKLSHKIKIAMIYFLKGLSNENE